MYLVHVFGDDSRSKRIRDLGRQIRPSPRVRALLAHRDSRGRLRPVGNPYSKWQGAHWVLATLADIGYPRADRSLFALRDQVLDRRSEEHTSELQSLRHLVCRLLLEKKRNITPT